MSFIPPMSWAHTVLATALLERGLPWGRVCLGQGCEFNDAAEPF